MVKDKYILAASAILLTLVVFFFNSLVHGPMIQGDEGSYLANAAAIAGYPNDQSNSYHAGYSLLIAPAFLLGEGPLTIWKFIIVINSALYLATFYLLWLTSLELYPKFQFLQRLLAVVAISLYPAWVIMVGYSFAQIAFFPVYLATFLVYLRSINGDIKWWIVLGFITGFLYWVHPTGIVPVIAVVLSAAYISFKRRKVSLFLLLVLIISSMTLTYRLGLMPWLQEHMTSSGLEPNSHYPSISQLLLPLSSIPSLIEFSARMAGQIFYLSVGTIGIFWLGLFTVVKDATADGNTQDDIEILTHRSIAIFLSLTIIGSIALPALMLTSLTEASRLDQWLYGRYVEGVIAPILMIGILSASYRNAIWAIPISITCLFLTFETMGKITNVAPFNISAFWQFHTLHEYNLWVWLSAGSTIIILISLLKRSHGIIILSCVFIYSSYLHIKWHISSSYNVTSRWSAALAVRDTFNPGKCVGFDYSGVDSFSKAVFWKDFGFLLFDYDLKRQTYEDWYSHCDGPLFSYSAELDHDNNTIHPIAASPMGGPFVWVKGQPSSKPLYPILVTNRKPSIELIRTLISGWHDIETSHVWSKPKAKLKLAVPEECISVQCTVKIIFSVFGASEKRPVEVFFILKSNEISTTIPFMAKSARKQSVLIPLDGDQVSTNLLIKTPSATSPYDLYEGNDTRILGIALHSIQLYK